ncbi:MAG: ATP-binding protein [Candidatus Omnitrophota bacterium]
MNEQQIGKIKLLLVADDEDFCSALSSRLTKRNFEVTLAHSAEEALEKFKNSHFDVIIADIKLPGIDGIKYLTSVREINEDIPVILITGYANLESAKEAVKLKASEYLLKPLEDINELLNPVYKAVHSYRLARENRKLLENLKVKVKELEKSERKYKNLFELASDIICTIDYEGKITASNKKMEEVTGYKREELVGKSVGDIIVYVDNANSSHNLHDISENQLMEIVVVKMITKSGKEKLGEMSVSPIKEGAKITGMQYIIRDITERRKTEETQRLACLGELAASMAHEVNNPLQIISGRAQLALLKEQENKEIKDNLKTIIDQCERAKNIIQRLLMFSKPSKGELKGVNINETIDCVIDLVEHQYSLSNIKIQKHYSPLLPTVRIDEEQMHEVFMNLIKNSVDAMPDGGTITIVTESWDGKVRVDLKDTGNGISKEDLAEIFDPFFTTKEKGVGLGLAVCYGIVKAHNGELRYESEVGSGTTAIVVLPAER